MITPVKCQHMRFEAKVAVARLLESGRFNAEIKIRCTECQKPFRFLGLKVGLDTGGAMINPDGTEARIAIVPVDEEQPDWAGVTGFTSERKGTH